MEEQKIYPKSPTTYIWDTA